MKSKLLHEKAGLKTFAVVFDKGDDVRQALLEFANANRFGDAHLTAIGAFSEVTLGYFDRNRKDYNKIDIPEQVEVLSFSGNIVMEDGKPRLHAHVVSAKRTVALTAATFWRAGLADFGDDSDGTTCTFPACARSGNRFSPY